VTAALQHIIIKAYKLLTFLVKTFWQYKVPGTKSSYKSKVRIMYRKIEPLIFLLILLFLLIGSASAGTVKILSPTTGDQLVSGKANPIILDIDWSQLAVPVTKYTLYYRIGPYDNWKTITNRSCWTSGECSDSNPCCPTFYPWEVPSLGKNKYNSQVKIKFFDANGNIISKKTSNTFTILAHGSTHPLSISPKTRTVAAGGVDCYWITFGQPPYTVNTSEHSITTVYEESEPPIPPMPPVTINSNMFYVKNQLYTCPDSTDIKVTISVTDSTNSTATAEYVIDCTP